MKRVHLTYPCLIAASLLASAGLFSSNSFAQWTNEKPLRAKLVSYDAQCAVFREESGEKVSVRRSSLGDLKLVAGVTEIQYFHEALTKNLCPAAPRATGG